MQGLVLLFTAPIARFDLLALLGPPKLELIQETIHLGHHSPAHEVGSRPVGEQCIEHRLRLGVIFPSAARLNQR